MVEGICCVVQLSNNDFLEHEPTMTYYCMQPPQEFDPDHGERVPQSW